jgi:anti-anti-sigma regulatory factor
MNGAMQLSIDVSNTNDAAVLTCRGEIIHGRESDYLFALATRPDRRDVILDVTGVTGFDEGGLSVIILSYRMLTSCQRRLFLRNPSLEMLAGIRRYHAESQEESSVTPAFATPLASSQAVQ